MIYGYIRVSTTLQNVENGKFEIANFVQKCDFSIDKWIVEQISSKKELKKRKLSNLLKKLKKGDIVIATEISRFGRNILELLEILNLCLKKECQVWTIKENYRLGADISNKMLAIVFGIVAEFERSLISSRTKDALARIKASGKKLGRPLGSRSSMNKLFKQISYIETLLKEGKTKRQIAKIVNTSETTFYRFLKIKPLAPRLNNKLPTAKTE